jgi:hypothetical protein
MKKAPVLLGQQHRCLLHLDCAAAQPLMGTEEHRVGLALVQVMGRVPMTGPHELGGIQEGGQSQSVAVLLGQQRRGDVVEGHVRALVLVARRWHLLPVDY